MAKDRQHKINTAALILAVLTALGASAFFAVRFYNARYVPRHTLVTVPDNLISAEKENAAFTPSEIPSALENPAPLENPSASIIPSASEIPSALENPSASEIPAPPTAETAVPGHTEPPAAQFTERTAEPTAEIKSARVLKIYKRHPDDNTPFYVDNMFPGDTETKYYLVQVSHKDSIVVKFRADIRPSYEKLAEVLMCRIELLTTDETLYEGLMRDMPRELNHLLATSADNELYYKITAYLDTSVGNEYQNKELIADFVWWVDDEGGLIPPPHTGGASYLWLGIAFIGAALLIIILLLTKRGRKKGGNSCLVTQ